MLLAKNSLNHFCEMSSINEKDALFMYSKIVQFCINEIVDKIFFFIVIFEGQNQATILKDIDI